MASACVRAFSNECCKWCFPESALLSRSIDSPLNIFFLFPTPFHTHAKTYKHTLQHTLTCAFIFSQQQPSGTVALIRVQKGGAAMAATSIVDVTTCDLCMRKERNNLVQMLRDCRRLDSCALHERLFNCVRLRPVHSPDNTRSARGPWCSGPLVFTHTSTQPPLPFSHSSERKTHTTPGYTVNVRWFLFF